ncbi:MAG: ATP-binding protein [Verrucomicrobiota bacterium]
MNLDLLLKSLLALPNETEWVEFKHNNDAPEEIGEYLSALSNSAALHGREAGYIVWGVEDVTKRVVGTTANPRRRRIGNEELENWLAHLLSPRVDFRFHEWEDQGNRMVLLQVQPAVGCPVAFQGIEWIRVGGIKKKLKDHPGKEKELWLALSRLSFEKSIAAEGVTGDDVLTWLDYPKYFELSNQKLPANRSGILERLAVDRLIVPKGGDYFEITNVGAILFAKQLSQFEGLGRKAFRVIRYKGTNRVETEHEKAGVKGYAAGFEGMVGYINDQLPRNEVMGKALRKEVRMYPERAIRELVANAMIHQDFGITGTGPMVEIFDDRLEVSNPGVPLIDTLRFIDHSPRSRNEMLADLMRRLGICEERGSGFDKVVFEIEFFQLPAPDVRTDLTHTRVVLFAHQDLAKMDKRDKVRACYLHCCLLYVSNKVMTNTTLRERFKIAEQDYPVASRIIRETIEAGLIKLEDPISKSKKHARYVPFWA